MPILYSLPMPRTEYLGLAFGTYCGEPGLTNWRGDWNRSWNVIKDRIAYDFAVSLAAFDLTLND